MFRNFVSLGPACSVASSMSKYGLRSWSGPFDWLITNDFKWVLHFIENDFENFLDKQYLRRLSENDDNFRQFRDEQSGFVFLHDREYSFEEQYKELNQKYQRRIDRFLSESKNPTCFLRYVISREEIEYISNNSGYINSVIKKRNSENEIVFIVDYGLELSKQSSYKNYKISEKIQFDVYPTRDQLRSIFDGLDKFLVWCAQNYDASSIMEGIIFDQNKEKAFRQQKEEKSKISDIDSKRYHILTKLLNCNINDMQLPQEIVIYGAGNIGKAFLQKIKEKCKVKYFVDKEKKGQIIEDIAVKGVEETICDNSMTFVVTAFYDFENIYKDIKTYCVNATIISLEDILRNTEDIAEESNYGHFR